MQEIGRGRRCSKASRTPLIVRQSITPSSPRSPQPILDGRTATPLTVHASLDSFYTKRVRTCRSVNGLAGGGSLCSSPNTTPPNTVATAPFFLPALPQCPTTRENPLGAATALWAGLTNPRWLHVEARTAKSIDPEEMTKIVHSKTPAPKI